jgi:RimJ/RimL family protein N-acetyltransferase
MALRERPPAFGAVMEEEPDLAAMGRRLVATEDRCIFGAFADGALVGIVRFSRYEAANEKHGAYVAGLYVTPSLRQQGQGRALMQAALDRAAADTAIRRVNLTVVTEQRAAVRLYESLGFVIYGTERETFACDGRFYDEHLMTLAMAGN